MHKNIVVTAALLASLATARADAQFAGLLRKPLGMPAIGEAGGAYQSNNQIRTFIFADPYDRINLYKKIIIKAGEMAKDKGYPAFGVTKYNCSTLLVNGMPRSNSCYAIAIMTDNGIEVKQRGQRKVQYYNVSDVLSGIITPPIE